MRPVIVALIIVVAMGCNGKTATIRGSGEPVTRTIPVSRLNGIRVSGPMDVVVTAGDTQHVEVTAQPELIDLVRLRVDNGLWNVTTSRPFSSSKEFTVHLTVPNLNAIIVDGSGDVTSEPVFNSGKTRLEVNGSGSIRVDTLYETLAEAWITGSGDIVLRGECAMLDARLTGSGDLEGRDLCATNTTADLSGSGEMTVDALDTLRVRISGSGNLRYRGNAFVAERSITGSGTLDRIME